MCIYSPFFSLVIDGANPNVAAAAGVSPNVSGIFIIIFSCIQLCFMSSSLNVLVSNPAAASGITYGEFL